MHPLSTVHAVAPGPVDIKFCSIVNVEGLSLPFSIFSPPHRNLCAISKVSQAPRYVVNFTMMTGTRLVLSHRTRSDISVRKKSANARQDVIANCSNTFSCG